MRYLWVVGAALYLGIIAYIGWHRIEDALASIDPKMLACAVGVCALSLWVRALKWRLMLGAGQKAVGLFFLSKAGGGMSPGRVGELAPMMLKKHRTPRMGAWIVTDRLLEIAATLGLGLFGLLALRIPKGAIALTFAAAMCVLVIAPFFVLTRRRAFLWIAGRSRGGTLPHRTAMLIAAISDEIRLLGRKIPAASAMTVLATSLDLVVGMFLYMSFGYQVAFPLLAVVQCAHALASAVPLTPNATGVPYLVAAGLLYQIGGVPEDVLAAAVGVNMAVAGVVFWTSFLFGAAELRRQSTAGDGQSSLFDCLVSRDRLYIYEPEALRRLNELVPGKGRVLDVGCGDGAIAEAFDSPWIAAFDISPRCAALGHRRGLHSLVSDAGARFPFRDDAFDTAYCVDVLHHLHGAWDHVLGELDRVVVAGGAIAIIEPDAGYAFVRWTQAPWSPIRVAPCANEPAIYPDELTSRLKRLGFDVECNPIRIDGSQVERSVFPLWQRALKAPFVMLLAWMHGGRPNKFAIVARKKAKGTP